MPGIAENALWDAIKWLLTTLFLAILAVVVGWMKGAPGMALLGIFAIVFVSVLFLMIFVQLRRLKLDLQSSPINVGQQSQVIVQEVQSLKPLKNAPYLLSTGSGVTVSNFLNDYEEEAVSRSALWTLSITNDLLPSDVGAAEATGVRAELTYCDAKWQRLFGPVQGGWIVKRGGGGNSGTYLNTDLITIGPQETHQLAIVIRMGTETSFFALGKESLPFFCWRNPAFELDNHCMFQVVLKGDVVQRTFHFRLRCIEGGTLSVITCPNDAEE